MDTLDVQVAARNLQKSSNDVLQVIEALFQSLVQRDKRIAEYDARIAELEAKLKALESPDVQPNDDVKN